jgi:hypothetical protein
MKWSMSTMSAIALADIAYVAFDVAFGGKADIVIAMRNVR